MTNALPGAWKLIVDSWHAFVKDWNTTVKYSIWMVLVAAIQQIVVFFPEEEASFWVAFGLSLVVGVVLALWVSIRLYQVILSLESGKTVDAKTTASAMTLLLPFLLVAVLEGVSVLGATILFIIPGIYVGVRLAFSKFTLLDQNKRGRAALVESWNLTKNKFWAIFGRQLAAGIVFAVGVMIITAILMVLLSLAMGGGFEGTANSNIGAFLLGLVNGLVQAALLPLFAVFQVKLYYALKKAA